ncbi:MAG: CRISPR-associated endonuclease Cas3'', partial [Flavobacterium sp.]|nr:CRISPR-associated endonuclease Cas3'' [Flavobacterium sp.]
MLSASTREFLSHPVENPKPKLIDHLLEVGKNADKFFSETKFMNKSLALYAGLLHDIGKISPWYQDVFHASARNRKQVEKDALEKYVQEHARFSARAAYFVLRNSKLDDSTVEKIMVIIYGHHTKIRQKLGDIPKSDKFLTTQTAISEAMTKFSTQVTKVPELSEFDWNDCSKKFLRTLTFDVDLKNYSQQSPDDYLEISCAFSCLLQADSGSFTRWTVPNFDLELDTSKLVRDTPLAKARADFQRQVMGNFDVNQGISIINA